MSEIVKKIEALEAELQKLKNEVKQEVKFEVGKWYKSLLESNFLFFLSVIKGGEHYGYGVGCSGTWHDYSGNWGLRGCVPATNQEVEELLIKEAKKRGFKEGVKINNSMIKLCSRTNGEVLNNNFEYNIEGAFRGCLMIDGYVIFKDGVWAEIVKDEPIKIGGYEVVFMGKKGTSDILYTKIDGHDFLKEFWQSAKVISEHSKAKIMVGCSKQFDVSLETINQILKKL